jgi:hypothetical protein
MLARHSLACGVQFTRSIGGAEHAEGLQKDDARIGEVKNSAQRIAEWLQEEYEHMDPPYQCLGNTDISCGGYVDTCRYFFNFSSEGIQ